MCGRAFNRPTAAAVVAAQAVSPGAAKRESVPRLGSASGANVKFSVRCLTAATRAMSAPVGAALEIAAVRGRRDSTVAAEMCAAKAAAIEALVESRHPQISCSRGCHSQSCTA